MMSGWLGGLVEPYCVINNNVYNTYYCDMIDAMKEKDETRFTESCVGLYYYIGNSSDELTKKEYENWSKKEIEEDLETIVLQLVDNFGDSAIIERCLNWSEQINYKSDLLENAQEYIEYEPTEEEINWGQDLFMDYIMKVVEK